MEKTVYNHLKKKAARLSNYRFVCFTKKWLCDEFVVMNESNNLDEIVEYFENQPLGSRRESPRLIFDQLNGIVLRCHNEELVLQTLEILNREDLKGAQYPFQDPTRRWNLDNYLKTKIGENPLLEQINRYAGWFTERARRTSWNRYVIFTKCTLPLGFLILNPEHSADVSSMHKLLDDHQVPDTTPKLIFDQEEQQVLRTTNDGLVLNLLIRIIENELAEFEETGKLSGRWRHNRIWYFSKTKPIDQLVQEGIPFALSLH